MSIELHQSGLWERTCMVDSDSAPCQSHCQSHLLCETQEEGPPLRNNLILNHDPCPPCTAIFLPVGAIMLFESKPSPSPNSASLNFFSHRNTSGTPAPRCPRFTGFLSDTQMVDRKAQSHLYSVAVGLRSPGVASAPGCVPCCFSKAREEVEQSPLNTYLPLKNFKSSFCLFLSRAAE